MFDISDCVRDRQVPGSLGPPGTPKPDLETVGKARLPRFAPEGKSGPRVATPPIWPGSPEATPPGRITNY